MPKSFDVTFTEHATKITETISVEIPNDDWQTLIQFANYADQLETTEYVKTGMHDHCEVMTDGALRVVNPLPPAIQIRELLHVLRPLILENEGTYYSRVTSILNRYIDHRLWRNLLKGYRRSFRIDTSQQFFTIKVGSLVLNSEETLNLWLNGYEYHRDPEKRARLSSNIGEDLTEESKALFVDLLGAKVDVILDLRDLVRWLEHGSAVNVAHREAAL